MPMKKSNIFYLYHIKVKKRDFIIKSVKKRMKNLLPSNIRTKQALLAVSLALAFNWRIKQSSNITTILFTNVPALKLIVLKIILEGLHGEYRNELKIMRVKMYTFVFLNIHLKVDMKY